MVKDLVAIPLGQSGVSVEQRSAFHLLWLMAAEINILAGALVSACSPADSPFCTYSCALNGARTAAACC